MADDDKALVERLRGDWPEILVEKHWMMDSDAIDKQRAEAADRIEALSKENDRLKANLAIEAKFVDKLSVENERLNAIVADRLLGSSVDHRTFKDIIAENERKDAEIERLRDILEQWLATAREHLDTEVAGRTFEALRATK